MHLLLLLVIKLIGMMRRVRRCRLTPLRLRCWACGRRIRPVLAALRLRWRRLRRSTGFGLLLPLGSRCARRVFTSAFSAASGAVGNCAFDESSLHLYAINTSTLPIKPVKMICPYQVDRQNNN